MSVAEKLKTKYEGLRKILEDMERLKADRQFLSQFKSPLEFVDWFKAYVDPLLSLQYEIGAYWIQNADVKNVIAWLRQGVWNEWAANTVITRSVTEYRDLIDTEFMNVLAQQISDECRHYYIRSKVLKMYGGSMEGFQPIKEWVELFDFPLQCAARRKEWPYFQVKLTSTLQVVELTSVYHHRGVHDYFPKNPKLWEPPYREASQLFMETFREIEDDELFHWSIAERVWMKYAKDPETRAEILDCAAGALRASMEARIKRVELAERHAI
ncbi:hypothetical protein [Pyrobaculum aerophilum]|uniref:Uncharacterized protein n=1 Tax=Pyrobaculum aerophilum TaxID=13773 RepID=A0A371R5I0_9CREN|nr:hypothetical protein [Pyrobaculum aerophilum]RFA97581.1 hypothetical protein CGL51_02770 [Pyrobaculum aerophilum]RFA99335.1 hypothetical protein CGL52_03955 [Pyrobaculum aerophilum]